MARVEYLFKAISVAMRQRPIYYRSWDYCWSDYLFKLPRTVVNAFPKDGARVLQFYYFFRCLATGAKLRRRILSVAELTFRRMQTLVHSIPRMQVKSNTCSDPFSIAVYLSRFILVILIKYEC